MHSRSSPPNASAVPTVTVPRASRSRIDWPLLDGGGDKTPIWRTGPTPTEFLLMLESMSSLFEARDTDTLLRSSIELALGTVGLVRAGAYLYDEPAQLMLGTWGTALDGRIVDEHHSMFAIGEHGRQVFESAIAGRSLWTVVEDCPLIDQSDHTTRVVGRGWVVCTPIRVANRCYGMLYNDPGLTEQAIDLDKQERTAVLCSLVGATLAARGHSNQFSRLPSTTARHPTLRKAVHRLAHDPSLSGKDLGQALEVSVSRLSRLFKDELGISLVDYRNQVRLERFASAMQSGSMSLLQAALSAGFGSYAQFHRVFRAVHGRSPSDVHRGASVVHRG